MVAEDIVQHFEARTVGLRVGKAMVVCMSRRICVALYDEIVRLRPGWHADDDTDGVVKVVMTGAASDPPEWQPHIGSRAKQRRELLAKRMKDPADPLRIVLVRDMWLTGFDAPCLHTLYVDKPMRSHGLMQAIARVNRVFRDKPAGLVVDYIGIAQRLKDALSVYSPSDQEEVGIDEAEAVRALTERLDVVRGIFRPAPGLPGGFDYTPALAPDAAPALRLATLATAMDCVLQVQQVDAARAASEEDRKRALRRFPEAVAGLSRAFALTAATPEGQAAREEVGFLQTVRAALAKDAGDPEKGRKSSAAREMAIQQIVSRAVVSTEIVDILRAAGIERPDISVLSEEFLAEVRELPRRNLAVEALRKLLAGDIRTRGKANVTEARLFSERLDAAMARYHANAITTAEVLEELIAMAREMRERRERGEEEGLSPEEVAFFDALAAHGTAREAMGDPKLRVIAHELVSSIRSNITVDWMHRETARARMRVLVKKVLRKYGYPPDLESAAVQNVLRQAEALSAMWAA
jgi:type I restriction enzyme R subunit